MHPMYISFDIDEFWLRLLHEREQPTKSDTREQFSTQDSCANLA